MNYSGISPISVPEILLVSTILVLNFLLLFFFKTRTVIIIAMIFSHLAATLLYNIIIANFSILRTLTVATVVYSITTFGLIANSNQFHNIHDEKINFNNYKSFTTIILAFFLALTVILGSFYLIKNINITSFLIKKQQMTRESEVNKNPLIFPGHPVHINVKKYYLEKNFDNMSNFRQNNDENGKEKELHSEDVKEKLRNNPLVKSLGDIIMIIVGIMIAILLSYKNKKSDEIQPN